MMTVFLLACGTGRRDTERRDAAPVVFPPADSGPVILLCDEDGVLLCERYTMPNDRCWAASDLQLTRDCWALKAEGVMGPVRCSDFGIPVGEPYDPCPQSFSSPTGLGGWTCGCE